MLCPTCQAESRKFGRDRDGNQRYQCLACKKTFSDRPARPLGDMRIDLDKPLVVASRTRPKLARRKSIGRI